MAKSRADMPESPPREEMPVFSSRYSSQQIRLAEQILHRAAAFGECRKSGIEHKDCIKSWPDRVSEQPPRFPRQPFRSISRNGAGKRTHRNKCCPAFLLSGPKDLHPHSFAGKPGSILKNQVDFSCFPHPEVFRKALIKLFSLDTGFGVLSTFSSHRRQRALFFLLLSFFSEQVGRLSSSYGHESRIFCSF